MVVLNPAFVAGGPTGTLVAEGLLHPECERIVRFGKTDDDAPGKPLTLHRHQEEANTASPAWSSPPRTASRRTARSRAGRHRGAAVMGTRRDWDRARLQNRIKRNGTEPAAIDLPSSKPGAADRSPTGTAGKPSPSSNNDTGWFGTRRQWLRHVEQAFRAGLQPTVPRSVGRGVAKEIEALRMRLDIRAAFWNAAKRRKQAAAPRTNGTPPPNKRR